MEEKLINFVLFLLVFNCFMATVFMVIMFMILLKTYRLRKRLNSLNQQILEDTP